LVVRVLLPDTIRYEMLTSVQIAIRLHGSKGHRPARWLQPEMGVSNKYIGVLGKLELYGQPVLVQRTLLAATAEANAATITTADSTDWSPGDEILITSSGHLPFEHDHATIHSINGTTIILHDPLNHRHFGSSAPMTDPALVSKTRFSVVDTRSYVILISRSITIEGVNGDDSWGPVMSAGEEAVTWHEHGLKKQRMCALALLSCEGYLKRGTNMPPVAENLVAAQCLCALAMFPNPKLKQSPTLQIPWLLEAVKCGHAELWAARHNQTSTRSAAKPCKYHAAQLHVVQFIWPWNCACRCNVSEHIA
jgi:hypothetical protein